MGSTLGGIWRVASVAGRVLSKRGGRAPGCGRACQCPALGGLLANAECWLGCLAVLVPAAVGVPVCMPVGLRVLRGLGRGFALGLVGSGHGTGRKHANSGGGNEPSFRPAGEVKNIVYENRGAFNKYYLL